MNGVGTDGMYLKAGGKDFKKTETGGAGLMVHDETRFPNASAPGAEAERPAPVSSTV